MIDGNDVGKYYTTSGKDCWQLMWFCQEPSGEMKNVETGEKRGGSIYSLNPKDFVKLMPEKDIGGK